MIYRRRHDSSTLQSDVIHRMFHGLSEHLKPNTRVTATVSLLTRLRKTGWRSISPEMFLLFLFSRMYLHLALRPTVLSPAAGSLLILILLLSHLTLSTLWMSGPARMGRANAWANLGVLFDGNFGRESRTTTTMNNVRRYSCERINHGRILTYLHIYHVMRTSSLMESLCCPFVQCLCASFVCVCGFCCSD
jgi:hypothetical protein